MTHCCLPGNVNTILQGSLSTVFHTDDDDVKLGYKRTDRIGKLVPANFFLRLYFTFYIMKIQKLNFQTKYLEHKSQNQVVTSSR